MRLDRHQARAIQIQDRYRSCENCHSHGNRHHRYHATGLQLWSFISYFLARVSTVVRPLHDKPIRNKSALGRRFCKSGLAVGQQELWHIGTLEQLILQFCRPLLRALPVKPKLFLRSRWNDRGHDIVEVVRQDASTDDEDLPCSLWVVGIEYLVKRGSELSSIPHAPPPIGYPKLTIITDVNYLHLTGENPAPPEHGPSEERVRVLEPVKRRNQQSFFSHFTHHASHVSNTHAHQYHWYSVLVSTDLYFCAVLEVHQRPCSRAFSQFLPPSSHLVLDFEAFAPIKIITEHGLCRFDIARACSEEAEQCLRLSAPGLALARRMIVEICHRLPQQLELRKFGGADAVFHYGPFQLFIVTRTFQLELVNFREWHLSKRGIRGRRMRTHCSHGNLGLIRTPNTAGGDTHVSLPLLQPCMKKNC
mmetsp:Transcript_94177/g.155715  ORF Transcript_94177/g.155715 Transcript_94177/m.155715 type:complete len:419 (+) Transcript_94177:50-1306(+)